MAAIASDCKVVLSTIFVNYVGGQGKVSPLNRTRRKQPLVGQWGPISPITTWLSMLGTLDVNNLLLPVARSLSQ